MEAEWEEERMGCVCVGGEALPVIIAEICVQRVQIETHSHGGAQQLRDHLSKPEQKRKQAKKKKKSRFSPIALVRFSALMRARQRPFPVSERQSLPPCSL